MRSTSFFIFCAFLALASIPNIHAQTWSTSPSDTGWNNSLNWSPNTVPNSQTATAEFGASTVTSIDINTSFDVGTLQIDPGAPAYTITVNYTGIHGNNLQFYDLGVVNNSTSPLNFIGNAGTFIFFNGSTAGNATYTLNASPLNIPGEVDFNDTSSASSSTITVGAGCQLIFEDDSTANGTNITIQNGGFATFFSHSISDGSTFTINAGGEIDFDQDSSSSNFTVIDDGILDLSSTTSGSFSTNSFAGSGVVKLGSHTLTVGTLNTSDSFAGSIDGAGGSLIKTGTGTLTLSGSNGFTGALKLDNGNLLLTGTASLVSSSISIATGSTFLALNNASSSNATITNNGTLDLHDFSSLSNATITNSGTFYLRDNATVSNSAISTTGTIYLSNNAVMSNGSVQVSAGTAVYLQDSASAVGTSFANDGVVDFSGLSTTANAGGLSGSGRFLLGSHNLSLSASSLQSGTVSGSIEDGGAAGGTGASLIVGDNLFLTLTGTNTYSGNTTVNGNGRMNLSGSINPTGTVTTNDTAGFNFLGSSSARQMTVISNDNSFIGFGDTSTAATATIISNGAQSVQGGVGFFDNSNAGTAHITVNAGSALYLQDNSTADTATVVTVNGAVDVTASIAPVQTIGSLSGSGTYSLSGITLAVGSLNGNDVISATIQNEGGLNPGLFTGGFSKVGTGTVTLSGTSTYHGATTVEAGTLLVNGSLAPQSHTTVQSGATLGGIGTLSGSVTVDTGATLAPGGTSPGTLTLNGGLDLADGASLTFRLGISSDLLAVAGGALEVAPGAHLVLNLADSGGFGNGTYTLIDFTGTTTNNLDLSQFTLGSTIGGYTYELALNGTTLQVIAAPEPSTWAFLASGLTFLLLATRLRRSSLV